MSTRAPASGLDALGSFSALAHGYALGGPHADLSKGGREMYIGIGTLLIILILLILLL
jgi:hypothetical protein